MNKKKKFAKIAAIILAALTVFSAVIPAFAAEEDADYDIAYCWWEDSSNGTIKAAWDGCTSSTSYKLTVYRSSISSNHKVKDFTVSGTSKAVTSVIADKGSGTYYFTVYPTKGGEDYMIESEGFEVDNTMIRKIKNNDTSDEDRIAKQKGPKWTPNPDGTWGFVKENSTYYAKNEWLDINGERYYFNGNSAAVKGWQTINSNWYYFEESKTGRHAECALYRNETTPDGYYVNQDGKWEQNGQVVVNTQSSNTTAKARELSNVSISISDQGANVGVVRNVSVSGPNSVEISNVTFNVPYEQWRAGESISVSMDVKAKDGYSFTNKTKFSSSRGNVTATGSGNHRTVSVSFKAGISLETPTGVTVNSEGLLKWNKVNAAKRYRVKITPEDGTTEKIIITECKIDLSDYAYEEGVRVSIAALGPDKSNSGYTDSAEYTIDDFAEFMEENAIDGKFTGSGNKIYFKDEYGDKLYGWNKIGSNWYYFNENTGAAAIGWYQNESGQWYCFDNTGAMMRGWIEDGGFRYYLEEGEDEGAGIMYTGDRVIGNSTYSFNDGRRGDLPIGALIQ